MIGIIGFSTAVLIYEIYFDNLMVVSRESLGYRTLIMNVAMAISIMILIPNVTIVGIRAEKPTYNQTELSNSLGRSTNSSTDLNISCPDLTCIPNW